MRVILTPDDLKKGDLVPPGWYPAEISEYKEKEADTDKSTNCMFSFKVLEPEMFRGVSPTVRYNEKALGFGKTLWAVLGLPKDAQGNYELSTELFNKTVGFKLEVYIARGKNAESKKEWNDITDFRPSKASA